METIAYKPDTPLVAAMDVGGTWIRAALVDQKGNILWHHREPTRMSNNTESVERRVGRLARNTLQQAEGHVIVGLGLAAAGPLDPATGVMYGPPNLPELDGISLKSTLQDSLGISVIAGNDANLAALAEFTYGTGGRAPVLVYLTISTGIGGGIIIGGEIFQGAHGLAAELGHMCVSSNGPQCSCGSQGCLEAIASGTAIGHIARSRVIAGYTSMMTNLVMGDVNRIEAKTVFEAASKGDAMAIEIIEQAGEALGAGIVNILHSFDPDLIVVGGGVSKQWETLMPIVEPYVLSHAMEGYRNFFNLARSSLGDEIGLLGAATLAWRQLY